MTGAAYIRVSTDDQAELSPDAQLRVIREAAKADGCRLPDEFIFVEKRGISGRKAENRPEFQRMIALAKSARPSPFHRLYLWKFSRFARNQEESVFYKGILRKKCGIEIKSVSEPVTEDMFGRLIETIIEWFDEYYSINLSGEVLRGMTEKALRHGYQTSPCLGYAAVGGGKPFVIVEDEIAVVEFIFDAYHRGMDMAAIARELNQRSLLTKRGNLFDRRAVRRILTNPFYAGTVRWNGCQFTGAHEVRPALATLYEENRRRLEGEYRPAGRREPSDCGHWLSGLLVCGTCGATLSLSRAGANEAAGTAGSTGTTGSAGKSTGNRPACFQCWKYARGQHEGSCSITVRRAEETVLASLRQVLGLPGAPLWTPLEPAISQAPLLRLSLDRLEKREHRIRAAYENGIDTLEEYKKRKAALESERQALLAAEPAPASPWPAVQSLPELLTSPAVPPAIKSAALRRILKKIVLDRQSDRLIFHYYL